MIVIASVGELSTVIIIVSSAYVAADALPNTGIIRGIQCIQDRFEDTVLRCTGLYPLDTSFASSYKT